MKKAKILISLLLILALSATFFVGTMTVSADADDDEMVVIHDLLPILYEQWSADARLNVERDADGNVTISAGTGVVNEFDLIMRDISLFVTESMRFEVEATTDWLLGFRFNVYQEPGGVAVSTQAAPNVYTPFMQQFHINIWNRLHDDRVNSDVEIRGNVNPTNGLFDSRATAPFTTTPGASSFMSVNMRDLVEATRLLGSTAISGGFHASQIGPNGTYDWSRAVTFGKPGYITQQIGAVGDRPGWFSETLRDNAPVGIRFITNLASADAPAGTEITINSLQIVDYADAVPPTGNFYDILANYDASDWEQFNNNSPAPVAVVDTVSGVRFTQDDTEEEGGWATFGLSFDEPVDDVMALLAEFTTSAPGDSERGGAFRFFLLDEDGEIIGYPDDSVQLGDEILTGTYGNLNRAIPDAPATVYGIAIQLSANIEVDFTSLRLALVGANVAPPTSEAAPTSAPPSSGANAGTGVLLPIAAIAIFGTASVGAAVAAKRRKK